MVFLNGLRRRKEEEGRPSKNLEEGEGKGRSHRRKDANKVFQPVCFLSFSTDDKCHTTAKVFRITKCPPFFNSNAAFTSTRQS